MKQSEARKDFIDRTARKPQGEQAVKNYNDPKGHYKGFRIILDRLKLVADDVYVEIGCGGGILLKEALKTAKSAAALDHSPDMIALTRKNNATDVESGRLSVVQGDAASLLWPDDSFTAAASANMFFFIEQPKKMLKEVYRILGPGGRFAMVTTGKGFLGKISFGWLYNLRTYSDKEMEQMFRAVGFSIVDVKTGGLFPTQVCYAVKIE